MSIGSQRENAACLTSLDWLAPTLVIAQVDVSKPVGPNDKAVTFRVKLTAGRTHLQTWFYDALGKELCGAFYVYVRRISQRVQKCFAMTCRLGRAGQQGKILDGRLRYCGEKAGIVV